MIFYNNQNFQVLTFYFIFEQVKNVEGVVIGFISFKRKYKTGAEQNIVEKMTLTRKRTQSIRQRCPEKTIADLYTATALVTK